MPKHQDKIDIMAFGAHPDDIEIGAGGFLAKMADYGYKIGMVDLTRGEMGSRGSSDIRSEEAEKAAHILGAVWRINLEMPDGNVMVNHDQIMKIARLFRQHKPSIVIAPYWDDRHPDHVRCSQLVAEAHFKSGLKKLEPELKAYRPNVVLYYFLNRMENYSFIVDISKYYSKKQEAIGAHHSQFGEYGLKPLAVLGVKVPLQFIESRDRFQGAQIGIPYGEAFLVRTPVPIDDPMKIWGV
jgi:bacillithiol biosynthesis deacetylase BshB1